MYILRVCESSDLSLLDLIIQSHVLQPCLGGASPLGIALSLLCHAPPRVEGGGRREEGGGPYQS